MPRTSPVDERIRGALLAKLALRDAQNAFDRVFYKLTDDEQEAFRVFVGGTYYIATRSMSGFYDRSRDKQQAKALERVRLVASTLERDVKAAP